MKSTKIPLLICPSDPNFGPKLDASGNIDNYPINYADNVGVWFVYNPKTNTGGEGAFFPNSRLRTANFTDGLSKTLCLSEVKAFTPGFQNAGLPNPTLPDSPTSICSMGGTFKPDMRIRNGPTAR